MPATKVTAIPLGQMMLRGRIQPLNAGDVPMLAARGGKGAFRSAGGRAT